MVDDRMADRVVELMNEMLAADPVATRALLINRVPCNDVLANHPTIQCGRMEGGYNVGLMGVLSGLCGVYDDGPRAGWSGVCYDMEGEGAESRVIRFRRLPNEEGSAS